MNFLYAMYLRLGCYLLHILRCRRGVVFLVGSAVLFFLKGLAMLIAF